MGINVSSNIFKELYVHKYIYIKARFIEIKQSAETLKFVN